MSTDSQEIEACSSVRSNDSGEDEIDTGSRERASGRVDLGERGEVGGERRRQRVQGTMPGTAPRKISLPS